MTRLLLAMVALVLAAPGTSRDQAAGAHRPPAQGLVDLQKHKYRMAASVFRRVLKQRPDDRQVQSLLGQAYAGMHRCEEGLALMLPNVALPSFGADSAQMVASCYAQVGDLSEAVYWMDQAVLLAPRNRELQATLALYELGAGDQGAWERLDAALAESPGDEGGLMTTQALMLLATGQVDAVESVLAALKVIPGKRRYPMSFFVEARLELDLGNAERAETLFSRAYLRNKAYYPSIVLWGEAARRTGLPEETLYVLDNVGILRDQVRHDFTRTVRARAAVDLGDLELAQSLVDEALSIDSLSADTVASAWYLARAQGRAQEMEVWAERYALVELSPLRTLEQLIPLGQE